MLPIALALGLIPQLPSAGPLANGTAPDVWTSTEGEIEHSTEYWTEPVSVREAMARFGLVHAGSPGSTNLLASGQSGSVNQDPEGDMPRECVFSPDGSLVLIACRDTDTVTRFDVASETILGTWNVGDFPVDVAISPNGLYAAVACVFSDRVDILEIATGTITQAVVSGSEPFQVEFTSDSLRIVAACTGGGSSSSVSVINTTTGLEMSNFPTTPQGSGGFFLTPESGIFGNLFTRFALTPDDSTLVLPDGGGDAVGLYDLSTGTLTNSFSSAPGPRGIDISSDGTLAVISHLGSGDPLSVLDLTVPSLASVVSTADPSGDRVRITPDKTHAIVSALNSVQFVNLATGAVSSTVSTGTVGDIEITFDDQFAVVSNFNTRVISLATQSQVNVITVNSAYDSAASPVEHKLMALSNRFREDLQLYSTNGASGASLAVLQAGELDEGDAPRAVGISADGHTALIAGNTSDNVILVDVGTGDINGYVPTGERTLTVVGSPVGTDAIATNTEDDTVTVFNTDTGAVEATLAIGTRPANAVISPDGSRAFVLSVAGTDRVHFIDLAGAASSITGTLNSGQTGSVGYAYSVVSGMAVSPDGSMLGVCVSFDDELLLLDTATQAEIARVPVGDFPIDVAFSPDSTVAYVSNTFGDSVSKIDLTLNPPAVVSTAGGIDGPLRMTVGPVGDFVYVGSYADSECIALNTNTMVPVATLPLSGAPRDQSAVGDQLFVSQIDGTIARITMAGASSQVAETFAHTTGGAGMAFSASLGTAITSDPGAQDLALRTRFGGDINGFCPAMSPNSAGLLTAMWADGTFLAGADSLRLFAARMPQNQFGIFIVGTQSMLPATTPNSQGTLCLGGSLGRFNELSQIFNTGSSGTADLDIDTTSIPLNPGVPILAGQTWYFQAWHRDQNPGNTSNFSNGVSITFE